MIKTVIIMPNGLVAVFDENDQQIPKLQGVIFEKMKKIGEKSDINTEFQLGTEPMNLKWYFEKYRTSEASKT